MPGRPYERARIALGTMHGKERAIGKPFARLLGATLEVPKAIDTDAFGTFTGEIARAGTMTEAARAKARRAMKMTGLRLGLASEGSYGPHPHAPLIPGGVEAVVFIDETRGIEIRESIVVTKTNYDSRYWRPGEPIDGALARARFPSHAMTVRPESGAQGEAAQALVFKGLTSRMAVVSAAHACAEASPTGRALIVPDMRAHLNATRMAAVRRVATKLALRIACQCPACETPGFGMVDVARGLVCEECGSPTRSPIAEVHRCAKCSHETRVALVAEDARAEAGLCDYCNP